MDYDAMEKFFKWVPVIIVVSVVLNVGLGFYVFNNVMEKISCSLN